MSVQAIERKQKPLAWHAGAVEDVLQELQADRQGLGSDEAKRRLEQHGPNRLPEEEKESPLLRFLRQFHDVLIYILLVAAAFTAFLGEWIDTGVILAVVLINALIGFIQEGKAEQALEAIRRMLSLEATALRDGRRRQLPAERLVPGDIVLLEPGDRVPADLRLLNVKNLHVEEAVLTGESKPVAKSVAPVMESAVIADRVNIAYSGTLVTSGQAMGVVVATGQRTEIGRIGDLVAKVEKLTTPLLRKINAFGRYLSLAILTISAAVFGFGFFFRGFHVGELFMIVVSLAVAAIPEGLPAIMTITLALGVQRMAQRNAIIRRLPAVETLGSVTVICSDKTGTLTRNEMVARRVVTADEVFTVGGSGYLPEGELTRQNVPISPSDHPELVELARAGFLCSDAEIHRHEASGEWELEGDPTEGAVVVLSMKLGLEPQATARDYPRLDVIPFESERRFMATLNRTPDCLHARSEGERVIYVKGAPEKVLTLCDWQGRTEVKLAKPYWERNIDALADEGHRLLAVASKRVGIQTKHLDEEDVESGFTLLGLVGLIDPPRAEAVEAVKECRQAGIRVKMITGDHALTARRIGVELGIGDGEKVITGEMLEAASDEELVNLAVDDDVFARTSPEHKLRLVKALQARGEIVAMTGDGVNDAPALKRADVGVAMGIKGAEASKSVAEMVLADDNFVSIEEAVKEGRTIYDNLKKAILFLLPTNGAQALVVIAAVLFAFRELPVTPVQILWVNMIVAVTLALALAFEPAEPDIMRRLPRDPNEPILSGYLVWRIASVSIIIATLTLLLFFYMPGDIEAARTIAVNTLVAGQLFYLFNSRFIVQSALSWQGLVGNPKALLAAGVLILFQLAFTYFPLFQLWFGTEGLRLQDWLWILAAGLAVFLLVELEKWVSRRVRRKRA